MYAIKSTIVTLVSVGTLNNNSTVTAFSIQVVNKDGKQNLVMSHIVAVNLLMSMKSAQLMGTIFC
jgi:hypothetical protein